MVYTLIAGNGGITRDADNTVIPANLANTDWQAYQAWLALGNTPNPVPVVIPIRAQAGAAAFQSGVNLTSTGTPALNGNYACDLASQQAIAAIVASIGAGQGLPNALTAVQYFNSSGSSHSFTSANFLAFASAVRDYVYGVGLYVKGAIAILPTPNRTIP